MANIQKKLQFVSETFQQVLNEFSKSKMIEKFQKEFNEIINILELTAKSQKQLMSHCRELNTQLLINEEKFDEHKKQVIERENAIEEVKQDLNKACKCIENAERREIKYKEDIVVLEAKIAAFEKEIDVPVVEKDNTFEIEAEKEKMLLNSRILQLETDLQLKEECEMELKSKLAEVMAEVKQLENNLETLKLKLKNELGRSQRVSKDRLVTQSDIKIKEYKIRELENNIIELKKSSDTMEIRLNAYKLKTASHESKLAALHSLYNKAQDQADVQLQTINNLTLEKDKLNLLVERKDEDLKSLNGKLIEAMNSKESLIQKQLNLQNLKQNTEKNFDILKNKLLSAEKVIQKMVIKESHQNSKISTLLREKELLANNIVKMEDLIEKYRNEHKVSENERIGVLRELKEAQHRVDVQNRLISELELMKDQFLSDVADLTKKIEVLNDELCSHEDKEASLKESIIKLTSKLNQQIDISHAATFDRKMYCQNYKETKENEYQLKQKMDIFNNHINELKELLRDKTAEVEDYKSKYETTYQQNKKISGKVTKVQSEMEAIKLSKKHLDDKIHHYLQTISVKEKEIDVFRNKVFHLTEDCMILRSQQAGKKEELCYLREKLRVSEVETKKEQEQHINLENEIKLFKMELLRLTSEKKSLISQINDLEKIKQSFSYAKQELVQERFKTSALEREMQQPINIHRWRLLKGTDPDKYKLIENYQVLQKQLVNKTVESERKNVKLSNMGRLVEQLKNMIAKQKTQQDRSPGDINKKELLVKNDRIKVLSSEINMYETYMSSYQNEITQLKAEIRTLKVSQFLKRKTNIVPI